MSNFKTLTLMTIAALLSLPALAQDDALMETHNEHLTSNFASADFDQDGRLNADEFVSFVVLRAENGDEAYKDVVLGGEYTPAFNSYDTDASGEIELFELIPKLRESKKIVPEGDFLEPEVPETEGGF